MTKTENGSGTLTDMSRRAESIGEDGEAADSCVSDEADKTYDRVGGEDNCEGNEFELPQADTEYVDEAADAADGRRSLSERIEYERLIRTRFKQFYTEDTQKMINKRFKRYKAMEERLQKLEDDASSLRQREQQLEATLVLERDRVERETEQRVVAELVAARSRPRENGYAPRRSASKTDVSGLTRDQRADIAKRALKGEKISF